jgi:hypothetical protein
MPRSPRFVRPLLLGLVGCFLLTSLSGCGGCGSPRVDRFKQGYSRDDEEEATAAPAVKPVATNSGETSKSPASGTATPAAPNSAAPNSAASSPIAPGRRGEMPLSGAENIHIIPVDHAKLTTQGRRNHTLLRMRKISLAIGDYVAEHGRFPAAAIYNRDKYPLLSWRVHLLPYLGQESLYQQFHLNEPWNSAHNETLIARIPFVFQSPDRGDSKTNYLLVTGPTTVFPSVEGIKPQDVADGLANTVMLVEVNDDHAVPWTQPIDLSYVDTPDTEPRRGLGDLRDDGFFLAWANGKLGRVSPDVPNLSLRPMFTRAGKEPFKAESINQEALVEVEFKFLNRLKPKSEAVAGETPAPETTAARPGPGATPGAPTVTPASGAAARQRIPVPDDEAQKKSLALFREIYREQYDQAKSAKQKYEFAKKLLEQSGKLTADPAGRYVLLTVAAKVSGEIGDVTTTLSVAEKLLANYELDPFETKADFLLKATKVQPYSKACNDKIIDVGEDLIKQALALDDYSLAMELYDAALAAARRSRDKVKTDEIAARRKEIDAARTGYAKVEKVVASLQDDPENPDSNLTIGRYFCFIKRNYERGLPMLALGSDEGLKRLARQELKLPAAAEEQTALADAWWELAERETNKETRKEMTLRAVHWYLIVLPRLPAGLLQVKAEVRVKDAEKTHGKDAVETIRLAQKGKV